MLADDNKILRIVYTFFLGLLLAIFVGVGINTFYEGPKEPQYPIQLTVPVKEDSDEQRKVEADYNRQQQEYYEVFKQYNRNVSIIALAAAVLLMVASLAAEKRIRVMADGVMLGGLFTLVYSLIRGFASGDSKYTFVAAAIGLVLVGFVGYRRFAAPTQVTAKNTKK